MNFEDYITILDIEKQFNVKAGTIRSFIAREQVIPKDKIVKIGRQWFINKQWVKENYEER